MKVWGIDVEQANRIIRRVSTGYDGNIVFKRTPELDGRAVWFTLTTADTRKRGARRSASGRRVAACCWHGHRDIMLGILGSYPDCRIKTAHADYRGLADFAAKYESTGDTNIGSHYQPMAYRDACNCEEFDNV